MTVLGRVRNSIARASGDPDARQIPIAHIGHDEIRNLVVKVGGEPDTALFGAFRDEYADDAPVSEYPADETDEG